MLCLQCEETVKSLGCTKAGVCGKPSEVAELQDLLIYSLQGLALWVEEAKRVSIDMKEIHLMVCEALFATLTNVNFDPERIARYIYLVTSARDRIKEAVLSKGGRPPSHEAAAFVPGHDLQALLEQAKVASLENKKKFLDEDIFSLAYTLLVALKGVSAYAYHAARLGKDDRVVYDFLYKGLTYILEPHRLDLQGWVELLLEAGRINLRAMELLDMAHTSTYGHPQPTFVPLGHKAGKAILVSGHDLLDLERILKETEGKGIYVYTHGEMLPAHGYPGLKRYPHLYGHYGTSWVNQQREFSAFPGAILMTTNCLVPPKGDYAGRIFTTGPVGHPGIKHLSGEDFIPVLEVALKSPGFEEDQDKGKVLVGFGRNSVLGVAEKVIEAVKSGKIRHFFLVGGCDGRRKERDYYREFVLNTPKDTVILTLACGKFRFFDQDLGDIDGIPRLLDIGQCNDAYSAVKIAQALADTLGVGIDELPLSIICSWYEQKAAAILLTLLALGIKGIRLGPSLPAFMSPRVVEILQKAYDLKPITTPEEDLRAILGHN